MGQKSVHALLDNSLHSLLAFGFEEFLFVDVGVSMAYVVDHLLYVQAAGPRVRRNCDHVDRHPCHDCPFLARSAACRRPSPPLYRLGYLCLGAQFCGLAIKLNQIRARTDLKRIIP